MSGTRVSYHDEQQPLEGYLAARASGRNLPGVMPSWLNINECDLTKSVYMYIHMICELRRLKSNAQKHFLTCPVPVRTCGAPLAS
jgi:hypothetical protein